jgi:hypothetical protein
MPYVTVGQENGTNIDILCEDWGSGQPVVFSTSLYLQPGSACGLASDTEKSLARAIAETSTIDKVVSQQNKPTEQRKKHEHNYNERW